MKTVGSMLREARETKRLSLADVEGATRIRQKFLKAIEADDYGVLPSLTYAKGFVKNYAEYVGLSSDTVLAFFRRQTADVARSTLLPKGMADPLNRSPFELTPARFVGILVGGLIVVFLGYFGLQYRRLNRPPSLVIDQPKNEIIVTERKVDVFGRTDTDATVTINGTTTLVRGDGKFFDQVTLEPGVNTITIMATSRFGKTATEVRKVGLQ